METSRTVVLALLALFAGLLPAGTASALEIGQKAPDFALNGTDGKPVKLSDLTAKGPSSSTRSSRRSPPPEQRN